MAEQSKDNKPEVEEIDYVDFTNNLFLTPVGVRNILESLEYEDDDVTTLWALDDHLKEIAKNSEKQQQDVK